MTPLTLVLEKCDRVLCVDPVLTKPDLDNCCLFVDGEHILYVERFLLGVVLIDADSVNPYGQRFVVPSTLAELPGALKICKEILCDRIFNAVNV